MKMMGFVVIVLLILCHKATLAEEGPKLSLLVKEDKVYCRAEHSRSGNSPTPAIMLQSSNAGDIAQTESKWVDNNSLVQDIIYDQNIHSRYGTWWKSRIFFEADVLPLLDYHWEDFPIYEELYELFWSSAGRDVTISIRARDSVSIILNGEKHYYNITLGVWTHSIKVCPVGSKDMRECPQNDVAHRKLFDGSEWIHVTVVIRDSVLQLKLLESNKKVVTLLKVTTKGSFFTTLTARGNYVPAQFKIHDYYVLRCTSPYWPVSHYTVETPEFKSTYNPLCVSVLSLIWPEMEESYLRVTVVENGKEEELMTIRPLEEAAWQEVRGLYSTKSRNGTVRIRIQARNANKALIGAIRECNPMGDVRVISMNTTSSKDSTFSCASLHDQKRTVSKTSVIYIKSECSSLRKCSQYNTTCDKFSITESSCTDALLCDKTSDCCCEPKYVKPCIYRDLEAAVNLTVTSVADGPNSDCITIHWPDPCHVESFTLKSSIKRSDTWKEFQQLDSIKRDQSVLWDNHLYYSWCGYPSGETYKFEINYTMSIPNMEERHYHAEVTASLNYTARELNSLYRL